MPKKQDIEFPAKKLIRMTDEMADRITKFRFDKRIVSDNETIRLLLKAALDWHDRRDAAQAAAKAKTE
jgi:hypothetical protein